jgi:hypothetical protein
LPNWKLFRGERVLVDSDTDRRLVTISVRRLLETSLTDVDFDPRTRKTKFFFDDFCLLVTPADYLERVDDRDDYWIFYMPDNEVLAAGPAGIRVEHGDSTHSV